MMKGAIIPGGFWTRVSRLAWGKFALAPGYDGAVKHGMIGVVLTLEVVDVVLEEEDCCCWNLDMMLEGNGLVFTTELVMDSWSGFRKEISELVLVLLDFDTAATSCFLFPSLNFIRVRSPRLFLTSLDRLELPLPLPPLLLDPESLVVAAAVFSTVFTVTVVVDGILFNSEAVLGLFTPPLLLALKSLLCCF